MERTNQSNRKLLAILAVVAVVLVGIGAGGATLLASHPKTTTQATKMPVKAASTVASTTSQYKLTACTSGTSQNIANASYVVGTDIAPGNYKIVSQPAGIDWTNINIYSSKDEWVKQGSPSVEQGSADTSLAPDNNVPTYTKLTDGQYMQVDADPAIFTCQ